jgi:succinate dehydrogenase / fumarate reductase cytochrome b subunit
MMTRNPKRPLSPHLGIWKWGPAMAVSIVHRVTGNGLATAGALGLVWWLVAAASGEEAYATFMRCATSWPGYVVGIGLTWFLFQHLCSGVRHFVLDTGAGYELKTNRAWSLATFGISIMLTAATWLIISGKAL